MNTTNIIIGINAFAVIFACVGIFSVGMSNKFDNCNEKVRNIIHCVFLFMYTILILVNTFIYLYSGISKVDLLIFSLITFATGLIMLISTYIMREESMTVEIMLLFAILIFIAFMCTFYYSMIE